MAEEKMFSGKQRGKKQALLHTGNFPVRNHTKLFDTKSSH